MDAHRQSNKLDQSIADENRHRLRDANVFTTNIIGGPGCGKTELISATVQRLMLKRRIGIVTADTFTHLDADRLSRLGDQVIQIDPDHDRMLSPARLQMALNLLTLSALDILLIENVSSLMGPGEVDLGEDAKVGMFSVAAGEEKAAKFPDVVRSAKLIILNKLDLLSMMPFNTDAFENDVRRINPSAEFIKLSTRTGDGFEAWLEWLLRHSTAKQRS